MSNCPHGVPLFWACEQCVVGTSPSLPLLEHEPERHITTTRSAVEHREWPHTTPAGINRIAIDSQIVRGGHSYTATVYLSNELLSSAEVVSYLRRELARALEEKLHELIMDDICPGWHLSQGRAR